MKIEIGESLVYSYLRHEKQCLITQTNWKASSNWDVSERIKDAAIYEFNKINNHHEFSEIFKSKIDQTIKQAEIDVLGIDANNTVFAYEVAFHEGGLQYGDKISTRNRIIKKLLRAYITLMCYFPSHTYSIAFCSPKVTPATEKYILEYFEVLTNEFESENVNFHYLSNETFSNEIVKNALESTVNDADTSELFIRSIKLLNITSKFSTRERNININVISTSSEDSAHTVATDTFEIAYSGESVQNYVKSVMHHMFKNELLSVDEIEKLKDLTYSKGTFNLQFPLLRDKSTGYKDANDRARYWSTEVFDGKYYVCSQWWKERTPLYLENINRWVERINNENS